MMVKMPILSNLQPFIAPKVLYEWFWLRNIKYQIEWFGICSVVSYFVSNIQNQGDSPKKKNDPGWKIPSQQNYLLQIDFLVYHLCFSFRSSFCWQCVDDSKIIKSRKYLSSEQTIRSIRLRFILYGLPTRIKIDPFPPPFFVVL